VSVVKSLGAALAAAGAGLERARQETAAADRAVEQAAARAAGSGFLGIAQNLARSRAAIQEIGAGIGATIGRIGEAAQLVATTPKQPTPQETVALLGPLAQQLDSVHSAIGAVMEAIGKAQQVINTALQGGQPGPLLARLAAIRTTMLAVVQHNNQAKQHAATAVADARKTGDQGN